MKSLVPSFDSGPVSAHVGLVEIDLVLREAHSLKDKRRVIRSLKDRLQNSFNIAVAEIDYNDRHQRALLACTTVSNEGKHIESLLAKVVNFTKRHPGCEVLDYSIEHL